MLIKIEDMSAESVKSTAKLILVNVPNLSPAMDSAIERRDGRDIHTMTIHSMSKMEAAQ
jgi:hypothetical protein